MNSEIADYIDRARKVKQDRLDGRSVRNLGGLVVSGEREDILNELPTIDNYRLPIQNPDGSFPFMLGYSVLTFNSSGTPSGTSG